MDVVTLGMAKADTNKKTNYKSKRAALAIGTPLSTVAAVNSDELYRTIVRLPVATTRWRLRAANRNVQTNVALTTPLTSAGVYQGTPDYTGARWNGKFTAAPTQVVPAFSVPVDGSDYVSEWVTDPARQFKAHTDSLLSWNMVQTATGTGVGTEYVRQVFYAGSNGAANVATLAPGGFVTARMIGDFRIEYDFEGTQPVYLFLGDSITAGQGDGDVTLAQSGTLAHEAYPGVVSLALSAPVLNLGIGGATGPTFLAGRYTYTRADLTTTVPDAAVLMFGTNQLASLATLQADILAAIAVIKGLGVKKLYLGTVLPRKLSQGTLTADAAIGVTTLTSTASTGTGAVVIGAGRKQETVTVSSVAGTGPYTLTLSAGTAKAHTAGEYVNFSDEMRRQQINEWIRQVPRDVDAVIDFDAHIEMSNGSAAPDPRWMANDNLHLLRAGYQRMAQAALGIINR